MAPLLSRSEKGSTLFQYCSTVSLFARIRKCFHLHSCSLIHKSYNLPSELITLMFSVCVELTPRESTETQQLIISAVSWRKRREVESWGQESNSKSPNHKGSGLAAVLEFITGGQLKSCHLCATSCSTKWSIWSLIQQWIFYAKIFGPENKTKLESTVYIPSQCKRLWQGQWRCHFPPTPACRPWGHPGQRCTATSHHHYSATAAGDCSSLH